MSASETQLMKAVDDWSLVRWTDAAGDVLLTGLPSTSDPTRLLSSPFGVAYPLMLEGVGRVYLWADNFTNRTAPSVLERELAERYLKAASALVKRYARYGVSLEATQAHLQRAQTLFERQQWLESLTASVQAAESGVVGVARARLQRMRGRTAFLWGVCADEPSGAQQALQQLAPPLNLLHLQLGDTQPAWDVVVQQAQSARIATAASISTLKALTEATDILREAMNRYRGQIRYWSVATGVQAYPANETTVVRLTELCEATRILDFGIVRLLHGVHGLYEPQSPYPVLEYYAAHGVPFEAVLLEWHWYNGTLYDLDLLLERYGELGKPIHLALGLPPKTGYAVFSRVAPQAWAEGAALIALSKPYVVALHIPLRALPHSAGALASDGTPSELWSPIAAVAAWNAAIRD